MVADGETNFVYVSDLLAGRFPSVFKGLERILSEHGIGFGVLHGTKDIWIRDYAPIQVDRDGSFVLFRYLPDYLRHGYRHLITDAREIVAGLPGVRSCEFSDIVLDGGNVVRHRDKAVVTDKVFRENPEMGQAELRGELRRLLRVETLIVIPQEPGDVVGHADGVVRFIDDGSVLANDYKVVDPGYRRALLSVLKGEGLLVFEVPYWPSVREPRGIPPATGCYLNFLQLAGVVICPTYGKPEDRVAIEQLAGRMDDVLVRGLDCRKLAREGGAVHCVTWHIRR